MYKESNKNNLIVKLEYTMDVGYVRLKENLKEDELVIMSPTTVKLSDDSKTVVGVKHISDSEFGLENAKTLETCPFCNKVVTGKTTFITEPSGQKCHLKCYMNADY